MRLAALLLALTLTGCATVRDTASSPHTFATCTAVDTVSTYLAIKGGAVEMNPMMASLINTGWLPFVAFQAGIAWLIYVLHEEHGGHQVTKNALVLANVVKCGVAINNLGHLP